MRYQMLCIFIVGFCLPLSGVAGILLIHDESRKDTPVVEIRGPNVIKEKDKERITIVAKGNSSLLYTWEQMDDGKRLSLDMIVENTFPLSGVPPGSYQFKITVTDKLTGEKSHFVHNLYVKRVDPEFKVIMEDLKKTVKLPVSEVRFHANAEVSVGWVEYYKWEQVSGPACNLAGRDAKILEVSNLSSPGSYEFKLILTDNAGRNSKPYIATLIVESRLIKTEEAYNPPTIKKKVYPVPVPFRGGPENAAFILAWGII